MFVLHSIFCTSDISRRVYALHWEFIRFTTSIFDVITYIYFIEVPFPVFFFFREISNKGVNIVVCVNCVGWNVVQIDVFEEYWKLKSTVLGSGPGLDIF